MTFLGPQVRSNIRVTLIWAGSICVATILIAALAAGIAKDSQNVFAENGFLEDLSVVVWAFSAGVAISCAVAKKPRGPRLFSAWLGTLALLAALRELDAHTWLNPDTLGHLGVRYKLSWWLDGKVPALLKVGWLLVFLLVVLALSYPFVASMQTWLPLAASAAVPLGLLILSFIFLGLGFVVDDLLRGSKLLGFGTRHVLEETSELIGAFLFFAVALAFRSLASAQAELSTPSEDAAANES